MNNKKKFNLFSRTVIFLSALILLITAFGIGLFYYMFSIPEPKGMSLASWPQAFTNSFSVWTTYADGNLTIKETGLKRLDEYGLWIQFVDESGKEIFAHNKPDDYPAKYTASELMELGTGGYKNGNTVFVNSLDEYDEACSYIVGFPYDVGRYVLHYNGERVERLYPAAKRIIIFVFAGFILIVSGYTFWLSRELTKVTNGIEEVSVRSYTPMKENGVFREIYKALNKMDTDVRHADEISKKTERIRSEWIANITHDLKTPLSPIKGYAVLLADNSI